MPFLHYSIESPLAPELVLARLAVCTSKPPSFWEAFARSLDRWVEDRPAFHGTVGERSFRLHRAIRYRNSFLPLIRGTVKATATGSRVSITMFLHPLVAAVLFLWWFGAWQLFTRGSWGRPALLLVVVFGILLPFLSFAFEVVKANRLLEKAAKPDSAS